MSFNILLIDSDYLQELLLRKKLNEIDSENLIKIIRISDIQEAEKLLNDDIELNKLHAVLFACTMIKAGEEKVSGVSCLRKHVFRLREKGILVFAMSYHFGTPVREINKMGIGIINLVGTPLSISLGHP